MPHLRKDGFSGEGTEGEGRQGKNGMDIWKDGGEKRRQTSTHFACVVWEMNVCMAIRHLIILWICEEHPLYERW